MKLTHFAVAGLTLLLAAGAYLLFKPDISGPLEEQKASFERMLAERDKKMEQWEKALRDQKPPAAVADTSAEVKAAVEGKTDAAVARANKGIARVKAALAQQLPEETEVSGAGETVNNGPTRRTQEAVVAAAENVIETADEAARRILEEERDVINTSGIDAERIARDTAAVTGAIADDLAPRLTNIQTQIVAQPAIARVENANTAANEGFVILDRGLNANLAKGDAFAVRRGTAIIGRVIIGDTIEETRSVAEVIAKHLVKGMVLQKGDEIIKFDQ